MPLVRSMLLGSCVLSMSACAEDPELGEPVVEDTDIQAILDTFPAGFTKINDARFEMSMHSDLAADVYVLDEWAEEYRKIVFAVPGAEPDFAEGATIVKELFNVDGELASINVMYKGPPGYDEAFSDWYRASGDETRLLTATGKIAYCADCHGAQSTDDFLWGVAADNRL